MSAPMIIDGTSGGACHNGLDVFTVPPTNISINKSEERVILPMNSIEEHPYEFRVFSDNQWIDLAETYLYLQLSIQTRANDDAAWGNIQTADVNVAPIQSIGQSFIRQLKMHINNVEVYDSTNLYPYLSYIKNELSFSDDVKDVYLSSIGYAREGAMDQFADAGFAERVGWFADGHKVEFKSRLEFDLANQNRFLINNIDLVFTLYRADDAFLIQKLNALNKQYRIKVHAMKLYVKTVDVQPSVNVGMLKVLKNTPARYPVRKMEIRSCFLSRGRREITQNLFTNIVPRRLCIGLVSHTAYAGDASMSPFRFKPYNIRSITVNAAGLNYPAVNYNMWWAENSRQVIRPFTELHRQCSNFRNNSTNGVTFEKFLDGWTFFIIPLTSTMDDCVGFDLVRTGTTSVHLVFNEPIADPGVTMIAIGEFDQLMSIDEHRIVLTDGAIS